LKANFKVVNLLKQELYGNYSIQNLKIFMLDYY